MVWKHLSIVGYHENGGLFLFLFVPGSSVIVTATHEASTSEIAVIGEVTRLAAYLTRFTVSSISDEEREASDLYITRNRCFDIFYQHASDSSFNIVVKVVYLSA